MSLYSKVGMQAPLSFVLLVICIVSYNHLGALFLLRLTDHSKKGKVVYKEQILRRSEGRRG